MKGGCYVSRSPCLEMYSFEVPNGRLRMLGLYVHSNDSDSNPVASCSRKNVFIFLYCRDFRGTGASVREFIEDWLLSN